MTVAAGIPLTVENTENGTLTVKRKDKKLKSGDAANSGDVLSFTISASADIRFRRSSKRKYGKRQFLYNFGYRYIGNHTKLC